MFKIGYLSFDASIKIHKSGRYTSTKTSTIGHGGINGYIRHIDRGTDRKNGCEVHHSNPDIDTDYTLDNESYYRDCNGEWKQTTQSKDMVGAVNRRVDFAHTHGARISNKGQNDTVIVRPLVLQLDSDTICGHEDTWVWDMIQILEEMFGKDNLTGFSVHRDETNIHIHVVFVPCHEAKKENGEIKCTLSQTKFFKSPKQLASMHRKIRKSLCDKGYEVEQENKPIEEQLAGYYDKKGEWHQQGLTPDQLKQISDRVIDLKVKEIDMKLRSNEMAKIEKIVQNMRIEAMEKQEELERERTELLSQKTALENDRATVQEQMQTLAKEKVYVEKMKQETEEMLDKVFDVSSVCDRILNDEKNLNASFLEFLEREGKRTNKPTRQYVERLYEKFQKERRESLSDWQLEMLHIRSDHEQRKASVYVPDIIDSSTTTSSYNLSA